MFFADRVSPQKQLQTATSSLISFAIYLSTCSDTPLHSPTHLSAPTTQSTHHSLRVDCDGLRNEAQKKLKGDEESAPRKKKAVRERGG